MRWFFLLLPWIELFTLIRLGAHIGALSTLLYVFLTMVLGVQLMQLQGREVLQRLREAQMGWSIPPRLMVDDMAIGLAGLLLAVPGLVTDTLALLVLIGPLLRRLLGRHGGSGGPTPGARGPQVPPDAPLEGEYRRLDDDDV